MSRPSRNRLVFRQAPSYEWVCKMPTANPRSPFLPDLDDVIVNTRHNDWVLSRDHLWLIALEIMAEFHWELLRSWKL